MAEMDSEQLAGTATHQKVVSNVKEAKELSPVRFFDGGDSTIPTSLDLRPGVTNAIRNPEPRSVTVNPDGSVAGSPNLLDAPVAETVEVTEVTEEVPPAAPAVPETVIVKTEEIKVPAKA